MLLSTLYILSDVNMTIGIFSSLMSLPNYNEIINCILINFDLLFINCTLQFFPLKMLLLNQTLL